MCWRSACSPAWPKGLRADLRQHDLGRSYDSSLRRSMPSDHEETYDMLCDGDSHRRLPGRESRADQHAAAPASAAIFYDLVIQVAIVQSRAPSRATWCILICVGGCGEEKVEFPLSRARNTGRHDELHAMCSSKTMWRAALPGAGDAARHHGRGEIQRRGREPACAAPWRRFAISARIHEFRDEDGRAA